MLPELAYWDECFDGVRTRIRLEDGRTLSCVITRAAARALAHRPQLTQRECFRAVHTHARAIVAMARAKVAKHGGTTVILEAEDVEVTPS
jgi:deoxycytidylate deaminase